MAIPIATLNYQRVINMGQKPWMKPPCFFSDDQVLRRAIEQGLIGLGIVLGPWGHGDGNTSQP